MKKAVSVLLSLALVLSFLSLSGIAADNSEKLSFAVASDLHFNEPRSDFSHDIDDPVYWYANRRAAMEDESGFIIDSFLSECAENKDCKYVLISGDMADNGRTRPEDHRTVADKFRNFELKTGKKIYVINGNHDAGNNETDLTSFELFKEIYGDFGYNDSLSEPRVDCSYSVNLGDSYRLIALDSNDEFKSTEDGITLEKLSWVKSQVDAAKADDRYPILMMHHNLLDHLPVQRILSRNFIVKFHYSTAEYFADLGIKIVLTGHEHCSDVSEYTSLLGNKIYDFATTSLTMYPLSYRMFELSGDEIKYSEKKLSSLDYNSLQASCPDFTDSHIDLMKSDLNKYAKGFLKAGVKYRLELSMSKEKMGIDENAVYYNVVRTAVDGLLNLLNMPLYGENSFSSLAEKYGIDIPVTGYLSGWDLATDLVSWHYSGGESFDLSSDEVQTLLKAVIVILRDDVSDTADSLTLVKGLNYITSYFGIDSVSDCLTYMGIEVFGPVSPAEYLILALISPLVYEFAYDSDNVDDNNGILEGYSVSSLQNNIQNIGSNVNDFVFKMLLYLRISLKYTFKAIGCIL